MSKRFLVPRVPSLHHAGVRHAVQPALGLACPPMAKYIAVACGVNHHIRERGSGVPVTNFFLRVRCRVGCCRGREVDRVEFAVAPNRR